MLGAPQLHAVHAGRLANPPPAQLTKTQHDAEEKLRETQQDMLQLKESIAQATQQTGDDKRLELLREIEQKQKETDAMRAEKERLEEAAAEAESATKAETEKQKELDARQQQVTYT